MKKNMSASTFFVVSVLIFIFSSPFAQSAKETLIDKISKQKKVPVYFIPGIIRIDLGGRIPDNLDPELVNYHRDSARAALSDNQEVKNPRFEAVLPKEYISSTEVLASELNRVLETDVFFAVDGSDIPIINKTIKMFGVKQVIQMRDWNSTGYPIYVVDTVLGTYRNSLLGESFTFKVENSPVIYEISSLDKSPAIIASPAGMFGGGGAFGEEIYFDEYPKSINEYIKLYPPEKLLEKYKQSNIGGYDKFGKKQLKKYKKAVKKRLKKKKKN